MTQRTTDELLRTARAPRSSEEFGDAVAQLIERYKLVVYQQSIRLAGVDRSLADDVFQETFLRLFRWLGGTERDIATPSFPRLLATFARRAAIDLLRKRPHAVELLGDPAAPDSIDVLYYVQELMETLDERSREVLRLTYFENCSADEVAAKLSLTPGNVRVIRHRALDQLRDRVHSDDSTNSMKFM